MNIVIMNVQHQLLPEQEEMLERSFPNYEILPVPAEGWSQDEMRAMVEDSFNTEKKMGHHVVFLSPVPYLMALVVRECEYSHFGTSPMWGWSAWLFHNDKREKKELPGGKVISVVAQEGWEILAIT